MSNELPTIDKIRTGNKIKMLMQQNHLTISQLQLRLGMASATNIYAWCRGEITPGPDRLLHLANIFNCKIEDILMTSEEG